MFPSLDTMLDAAASLVETETPTGDLEALRIKIWTHNCHEGGGRVDDVEVARGLHANGPESVGQEPEPHHGAVP